MTIEPGTSSAPIMGEPLPVELMNTVWADRDGVHDALADQQAAAAWLSAVSDRLTLGQAGWLTLDYIADPVGLDRACRQLVQLRDALRRLAAEATGDPRTAGAASIANRDTAVAVLNGACALAPAWSQLHWLAGEDPTRAIRSAHPPAELAVSLIAEQAVRIFAGPQRGQLRACLGPGCVLYFLAKHPRREWCSDSCGNRARVARHYQRHRAPVASR